MLIDWFTVGAQALNFLILVWLMRRFLYKPILSAIDAREKRIAQELADADAKKSEAQKERDEFQRKNADWEQHRPALFKKATDEAEAERGRLLDEARKTANDLSAKRREGLRVDATNLNQAIAREAQEQVFVIARKALADLATTTLEEQMCNVFTRRLHEMGSADKLALGGAMKAATTPSLIRSAFDLPANQRAAIQDALNRSFSADLPLRFEKAPDLVSGIELTANGQKIAWSISNYLTSLETAVGELLKGKKPVVGEGEPQPEVATS